MFIPPITPIRLSIAFSILRVHATFHRFILLDTVADTVELSRLGSAACREVSRGFILSQAHTATGAWQPRKKDDSERHEKLYSIRGFGSSTRTRSWHSYCGSNALLFDPLIDRFESLPPTLPNVGVRQLAGRPGDVWGDEPGNDRLVWIGVGSRPRW